MANLSSNLRTLLSSKSLSIAELSRQTDVPQPVIHKLSTGKTMSPNITTLRPIAKYFNITCDQLMGYDELPLTLIDTQGLLKEVPIIRWRDVDNISELFKYYKPLGNIYTEISLSNAAFALKATDNIQLFSPGTILVFDKNKEPQNNHVVLSKLNNHLSLFKIIDLSDSCLIFDLSTNKKIYLPNLSEIFGTLVHTKSYIDEIVSNIDKGFQNHVDL